MIWLLLLIPLVLVGLLLMIVLLPVLMPMVLFQPGSTPQVLDGSTAVIGPIAPFVPSTSIIAGRPSQFALGLSSMDAYAACGPDAAIAFGQWWGVNLSIGQVMSFAVRGLWDANNGMHGVGAEQALLTDLRLPSRLESPANWSDITSEAAQSRPVILDTPGHYYFVDAVRSVGGTVQYHVGTSGTDLRGGSDWMSAAQINGMAVSAGHVRAALFAFTPAPAVPQHGAPR